MLSANKLSKNKFLLSCLIGLCAQPVFAIQTPKPASCPSIAAIKAIGVSTAEHFLGGYEWVAYNRSPVSYGTNNQWLFTIQALVAEDVASAIATGNANISLLTLTDGPTTTNNGLTWVCMYESQLGENERNYVGAAGTLPQ